MLYSESSAFPKDFLWGAGTSAYQVEGAHLKYGKTLSVVEKNINSNYADPSISSDHYHRFEEDVSLMAELGLTSYRFSISWPRVLPNGRGKVNLEGINFYKNLIQKLKEYNIEPIITIYHFDLPQCLQDEYGGWSSRKIIPDFLNYCDILFDYFGNEVKYWITINEQSNMFLLPYLMEFDPKLPLEKQKFEMNHIMTLAHAKAIKLCRKKIPDAKIGPAIGIIPNFPESCSPDNIMAAKHADDMRTFLFTDLYVYGRYKTNVWRYMEEKGIQPTIEKGDMETIKSAKPDFIGLNYYQSRVVRSTPDSSEQKDLKLNFDGKNDEVEFENIPGLYEGQSNPFLSKTEWDWEIDPQGLRYTLNQLHEQYELPILITENGLGAVDQLEDDGTVNDSYRINYIKDHLAQINLAIKDGVDVQGYYAWSFLDLLSTSSGFRKRYGLVYVNRSDHDSGDLRRIKKESFNWYKDVIESNGAKIFY